MSTTSAVDPIDDDGGAISSARYIHRDTHFSLDTVEAMIRASVDCAVMDSNLPGAEQMYDDAPMEAEDTDVPNVDHSSVENGEHPHADSEFIEAKWESQWEVRRFSSVESARDFYVEYSKVKGFGVRVRQEKEINGVYRYLTYSCNKKGESRSKKLRSKPSISAESPVVSIPPKKRQHRETRTGCPAEVTINLDMKDRLFKIKNWIVQHNHPLESLLVDFYRSNRHVSTLQGGIAIVNQRAGVKLRRNYSAISIACGGSINAGFKKGDLKNWLLAKRQKEMHPGEATALMNYFERKKDRNPSFLYVVQRDVDDKIASIFWSDAAMREDYSAFGDILTFDTTFNTNNKNRPLAVFVGVNHHRETCIFGAALLYDETTPTFEWLFKSFLSCMGNKFPKAILTDQQASIRIAISSCFPGVFRGLCTWHLLQNALRNLGQVYPLIRDEFVRLMYDVQSESEFDEGWDQMISSHVRMGSCAHHWLSNCRNLRK